MSRKNGYCSTGKSAASFAARTSEKAIVGLGRYAVKDHIGRGKGFTTISGLGFAQNFSFLLIQILARILGIALAGGLMYLLVVYGGPLLVKLIFYFPK